ncbi:MAG TPA: hypothetical protein VJB10_02030 [Candidatus Peribacteraceae bacterium]|nr:hypothetical protein [Candidatus Peribacteraceae bacterium]
MKYMKRFLVIVVFPALLFAGCREQTTPSDASESESSSGTQFSSESERIIRETNNVSYSGTVRPLGISIYMEGTHKLSLPDGRFILLESKTADLNGYVDESVVVVGAIRPTVESDAMIMRVDSISLQGTESESSEEEVGIASSTAKSDSTPPKEAGVSSSKEKTPSSSDANQLSSSTSTSAKASARSPSPAFLERQKEMAKEEFSAENWTQEYCSSHIGFCVPVHRNWWFTSFGATSTHYWHLEMNSAPFDLLHEGPLEVNLDGESLEALGVADGTIREEGETVIGFRSWTNGRHFEIRANITLKSAVEHITQNLHPAG